MGKWFDAEHLWRKDQQEADARQPWKQVRALANDYFKLKDLLAREEDFESRLQVSGDRSCIRNGLS